MDVPFPIELASQEHLKLRTVLLGGTMIDSVQQYMNYMAQRDPEGGSISAGQMEMHELQPKWLKTDRFSDGLQIIRYPRLCQTCFLPISKNI